MQTIDVHTQLRFERIMLATDFSPTASIAQAFAVGLALHDSSSLELTTVIDLSVALPCMDVLSELGLEALRRSGADELRRTAEDIVGVKVTRTLIEGFQPASLIVEEAIHSNCDLIVLGTASKHGLKKLVLGSTAEDVIRTAPCPILTVGPHVPRPSTWPLYFERIVYATDFSQPAAKAANLAIALSQTSGAKIYLCHVLSDKEARKHPDCEARFLSSLKALIPESATDWCRPECVVEHGKSSEAILAFAAKVHADLIVLGARKSSFWIEYVQPGVTPALLATAACPVLSVC
jgi:nucleotide-binding universal stress UspA family protein